MNTIPKKIHQIWLWKKMPEEFLEYQKSWIKKHPNWKFFIWDERNIQKLKYINLHDYNLCKNYSEKSDYLRFCILREHWWLHVDTDFECYKSIVPLLKNADFIIWEEFFWVYNAAFMAATKESKVVKKIFQEFHKQLKKTTHLCRTGPVFISQFINKHSKNIKIIPWELLYPEYWLYINKKTLPDKIYASHHYAASWQGMKRKKIFFLKQKISKYYWGKYLIIILHYLTMKGRILLYGKHWYQ